MSKLIGLAAALVVTMTAGCASSLLARHDISQVPGWVLAGRLEPDSSLPEACLKFWKAGDPGWRASFGAAEEHYRVERVAYKTPDSCNATVVVGNSENAADTDGWYTLEGQFSKGVFTGTSPHKMFQYELSFSDTFLRGSLKLVAAPDAGPYIYHIQHAGLTALEATPSTRKVTALVE